MFYYTITRLYYTLLYYYIKVCVISWHTKAGSRPLAGRPCRSRARGLD